jgi:hypothetical protein
MPHPLALTDHPNGANGMKAGDHVRYTIDGRTGVADEFLPDGDAFITWDDGSYGTVHWNHLVLSERQK